MKSCPTFFRLVCLLAVILPACLQAADVQAEETCQRCHNLPLTASGHGSSAVSCTSCHGPSGKHLSSPMKNAPDTSFGDVSGITNTGDSPGDRCLTCHDGGPMLHWQGSLHDSAAVSCNACHSAHKPEHDTQNNCLSCHENVKASLHLPSRHPMLENKIGCTDCHRPHGSINDSLLPGTLKTDVCIDCHQELRGPMLFEHEPVTEDCGLCHAPHGSVISDLLISRPPFLCQQCHMAADHSSQLSDGNSLLPGTVNLSAGSCLNCHSKVHGSNHPSGARLTR